MYICYVGVSFQYHFNKIHQYDAVSYNLHSVSQYLTLTPPLLTPLCQLWRITLIITVINIINITSYKHKMNIIIKNNYSYNIIYNFLDCNLLHYLFRNSHGETATTDSSTILSWMLCQRATKKNRATIIELSQQPCLGQVLLLLQRKSLLSLPSYLK